METTAVVVEKLSDEEVLPEFGHFLRYLPGHARSSGIHRPVLQVPLVRGPCMLRMPLRPRRRLLPRRTRRVLLRSPWGRVAQGRRGKQPV